jgi:hypothetical protein
VKRLVSSRNVVASVWPHHHRHCRILCLHVLIVVVTAEDHDLKPAQL